MIEGESPPAAINGEAFNRPRQNTENKALRLSVEPVDPAREGGRQIPIADRFVELNHWVREL